MNFPKKNPSLRRLSAHSSSRAAMISAMILPNSPARVSMSASPDLSASEKSCIIRLIVRTLSAYSFFSLPAFASSILP